MGYIFTFIGVIFVILLLMLRVEKRKTSKERMAREQVEEERDKLKVITTIQKQADEIKDDLVIKKEDNYQDKKEVEVEIEEIPEERKEELSDEVKKLAADQYKRANARRVSNK